MASDDTIERQFSLFFYWVFVPAIVAFVGWWTAFRLVIDEFLLSVGLVRLVPQSGVGSIAAGFGRFVLLVLLTTATVLVVFVARACLDDGFPPT